MLLAAFALATAAPPVALPQGPALVAAIAARDAELFDVYFNRCEPDRVRFMVTPDIEFYHDKGGVIARDADAFVADYARDCRAKQAPGAWRSRRELVRATLNVHPVPGYGAIEDGEHLFHERKGDGPKTLVGRARFTMLWALAPDGWRLARAFSYGHRAVPPEGGAAATK